MCVCFVVVGIIEELKKVQEEAKALENSLAEEHKQVVSALSANQSEAVQMLTAELNEYKVKSEEAEKTNQANVDKLKEEIKK